MSARGSLVLLATGTAATTTRSGRHQGQASLDHIRRCLGGTSTEPEGTMRTGR